MIRWCVCDKAQDGKMLESFSHYQTAESYYKAMIELTELDYELEDENASFEHEYNRRRFIRMKIRAKERFSIIAEEVDDSIFYIN